ncbi:MAG: hypothetical protein M3020_04840 [Myxococcota bacterium]|jgi:hypothetical protein|nr:hypothetical protein [Myxococcota bacterium]
MNEGNGSNGDRLHELEREAAAARSRLNERLAVLDERKDRLVQSVKGATRPPLSLVLIAGVGLAATVLIVRSLRRRRVGALERVATQWLAALEPPAPPSPVVNALKRGAMTLVAQGVQELGRRSVERWAPSHPGPHHADGYR